jgi:hypothetical protein
MGIGFATYKIFHEKGETLQCCPLIDKEFNRFKNKKGWGTGSTLSYP